ncbi:hypothetical protein BMS3Abin02_00648 [bacterium BMS3Abin02]|nr:hypothetical protein BMS3Abin02_00648 [bacterium BMS3Abin02]
MGALQCHILETLGRQLGFCDRASGEPGGEPCPNSVLEVKPPASAGSRARVLPQCDEDLIVLIRMGCVRQSAL